MSEVRIFLGAQRPLLPGRPPRRFHERTARSANDDRLVGREDSLLGLGHPKFDQDDCLLHQDHPLPVLDDSKFLEGDDLVVE